MRTRARASCLVALTLAVCAVPAEAAPVWYQLGSSASPVNFDAAKNGNFPSITDVGGKPHVAWTEMGASTRSVRASRLDGIHSAAEPWTALGGASPIGTTEADGLRPSFASVGGVPWVAWTQPDATNLEVRVSRFVSGAWQEVVGGASPINFDATKNAGEPSLIDIGGAAHVTWAELDGTSTPQVRVKRFNGSAWVDLGTNPIGAGFSPDIANVNGVPHVAFSSTGSPADVRVRRYNGTTWVAVGTDGQISDYGAQAGDPDIVGVGSQAWVVWAELAPAAGPFRIHVKRFTTGPTWVPPVSADQSLNHSDARHAVNPTITSVGGVPHVAWEEQDGTNTEIRAARMNFTDPGSWDELNGDNAANPINRSATLEAKNPEVSASGGRPVVAWEEIDEPPGSEATPNPNSNSQIYVAGYGEEPGVPTNATPPSMTGTPRTGTILACADGTWNDAATVARQWVRSVAAGPFVPIDGQVGTLYQVKPEDVGARVACRETGTNDYGFTTALSNFKTAADGVPVNRTPPAITGTPAEGNTLSCGDGAWDNQPLSSTRRWLADDQPIPGATGTELVLTPGLTDRRISCEVTTSNDVGQSSPSTSASVLAVNAAPTPLGQPRLKLIDKAGPVTPTNKRIECVPSPWERDPDPNAHQFRIEKVEGGVIADGSTHDVTIADLGREYVCVERVTNAKGSGEVRGVPATIPLPLDDLSGGVQMWKAGGYNQLDPVNLMVTPEGLNAALAPAQLARVQKAFAEFMTFCSTQRLPAGLPSKHPNSQPDEALRKRDLCRLLRGTPSDQIKILSNGVRIVADPEKCILGNADPCAPLPIPMPPAVETDQPVHPDLLPEQVLWDLDSSGTVDIACPGSAPVARSIYSAGWYRPRGILVLPGSEETGVYPTVTEYFDHHSPLPPTPEIPEYQTEPFDLMSLLLFDLSQIRGVGIDYPNVTIKNPLDLGFVNFQQGFAPRTQAAQNTPPSGIKPGKIRKTQPMWCWNKLEPPETKEQPCGPKGTIGAITVEGNICPVSLRQIPNDELENIKRTDDELWKILVAQNNALGAARRRRGPPIGKAAIKEYTPYLAYDFAQQEFAAWQPRRLDITKRVLAAVERAGLSRDQAPLILDQTAVVHGDGWPGVTGNVPPHVRVNGVKAEGRRAFLLPSEVGDAAGTVKKMRLFASDALPVVGDLPLGDPEKGLNAALDDAVGAGVQALIKESNLDDLRKSTSARVKQLLGNLDLGPFKLAGDVDVKLENGTAFIDAWAELPLFNKVRGRVQLRATPDGQVQFDGITIDLRKQPIKLGAVKLQKVFIEYQRSTGLLLKGELVFIGGGVEIVEFRIDNENTIKALVVNYIAGAGTGIKVGPGVFLTKIGGGFRDTKAAKEFEANATLSVGTSVGQGCSPLAANGKLLLHFEPYPFYIRGDLGIEVVCLGIAKGFFTADENGKVHIEAEMDFEGGPLFFHAGLNGDIRLPHWQVTLDVNGGIRLPDPLPDIKGKIAGVISSRGMAACGEVPFAGLEMGAGIQWNPALLTGPLGIISSIELFTGCGMEKFKPITPSSLRSAQTGGRSFTVERGEDNLVLSVEGLGAAPRATLRGPDGTVVDVTGEDEGVHAGRAVGMRIEDEDRTVFLVKDPAAGDWTVTPAADSVEIVNIRQARVAPEPRVSARVVRAGSAYELRWSVARHDGQVVRFVEQAPGGGQDLLTVRGGGRGVKRFIPSEATSARRAIVAQVEQDGMPRKNIEVVKFSAPSPRVGRAGRLRARRRGRGAVITWSRAFLARGYEVTVTTTTGERSLYTTTAGRRQITIPRLSTRDSLTATVVGVSPAGKLGPGARVKLGVVKRRARR